MSTPELSPLAACAVDIARLSGEPLAPLLEAATSPPGSLAQVALIRRVQRCIHTAAPSRPGHFWTDTVQWMERHGVPA